MTTRLVTKCADGLTIATTLAMLVFVVVDAATLTPSRGLSALAHGIIIGILSVGVAVQLILCFALNIYKYVISPRAQHSRRTWLIVCAILHILVLILPCLLFLASIDLYSSRASWKGYVTWMIVISCTGFTSNLIAIIALSFTPHQKEA